MTRGAPVSRHLLCLRMLREAPVTCPELVDILGVSHSTAYEWLTDLVQRGRATRRRAPNPEPGTGRRRLWVYTLSPRAPIAAWASP